MRSVAKQRRWPHAPVVDWLAVHDDKAAKALGEPKHARRNLAGLGNHVPERLAAALFDRSSAMAHFPSERKII
jgi:hypothetical protein